jgi:hypothetical protein
VKVQPSKKEDPLCSSTSFHGVDTATPVLELATEEAVRVEDAEGTEETEEELLPVEVEPVPGLQNTT